MEALKILVLYGIGRRRVTYPFIDEAHDGPRWNIPPPKLPRVNDRDHLA
jgi:hypothetical protein